MSAFSISYRAEPTGMDRQAVRLLAAETGFFSAGEIDIAAELVAERLAHGEESGYLFLFAERPDRLVGYACFGPIPGTQGSFDLYWIIVAPSLQGQGTGKALLFAAEREMMARGARRIYIDTSSRPQYEPTRAFYKQCGYRKEAFLEDFYSPGDGKVIFSKSL